MPSGGHLQMIEDYKKRFFICLALTVPIVILSETAQSLFGVRFSFPGAEYLVFIRKKASQRRRTWPIKPH